MTAYLDHNATTPLRPEAAAVLCDVGSMVGNPSSVHRAGRQARAVVDKARDDIADEAGVCAADVIFTSGGTEANNLALNALPARTSTEPDSVRLLVSAVEHASVSAAAEQISCGFQTIPVDPCGVVDIAALDRLLETYPDVGLVSVMLANNETGVIQPIARIAESVHRHGALLHCDAVQAFGRIKLSAVELGADLLTISAHKIGGPQGVGALIAVNSPDITAQIVGGGQELGRRGGTENVAGIAAFAAAVTAASSSRNTEYDRLEGLRDDFEQRLHAICPDLMIYGAEAPRLPNTSCFGLSGLNNATAVMALDLDGIAVSAGAACSSGKVGGSTTLAAMGVGEQDANCAIRVSLGWTSTADDIERFLAAWQCLALDVSRNNISPAVPSAA